MGVDNMRDKKIRVADIIPESVVDGRGIRYVIFSQGCRHRCPNCFNPQTHSFDGGHLYDMDEILEDIKNYPLDTGVTFSGGDPLEQADKFSYIAKEVKTMGLDVWSYTGYTFEYILRHRKERKGWNDFINCIDVLVDGRFQEEKKDISLAFRGSSNQRIINVPRSLAMGQVSLLKI